VLNCHFSRDPVWTWPVTVRYCTDGLLPCLVCAALLPCCPDPVVYRAFCTLSIRGHRLRELLLPDAHFVMSCALPASSETPRDLLQVALETRRPGAWLGSTVLQYCTGLYWISNFQSPLIPRSIHSADYARSDSACCPPSPPSPDSKSSSQSEWSANKHPCRASQCMLCPSES
jgi:hypothetical protein